MALHALLHLLNVYYQGCLPYNVLVITVCTMLYKLFFSKSFYCRFRRFGRPWYLPLLPSKPVHDLVAQGYREKNNEPFVVRWWARDWLVLPPKYLRDVKHSNSESLSFFRAIDEALGLHYSVGNLYHSQKMSEVIKKGMNTQLPTLTEPIVSEVEHAIESHIGTSKEWKEIPAARTISRLVNQVACRMLIGPELCRDQAFLDATLAFMESIFFHAIITIAVPFGPFRRLFAKLVAFSHRRNLRKAMQMLQPLVARRIREREDDESKSNRNNDGIQWTLDLTEATKRDPYQISLEVLHNLFAGSLAPGSMVTELVFQALMDFNLLEQLRNEASQAIELYGWTEKLLANLPLQDSFIRELNRVYPTGATGCSRLVMDKSFTFHDGLTVPRGTRITFPIQAVLHDVDNFENPSVFDPYRFFNKRSTVSEDHATEYQWAASTATPTNLAFGYGKHVCPGRFYCVRQCKIIFTKILVDYEIGWSSPMKERPRRDEIEGQFGTNKSQTIRVRRRG
ncbi:putative cytochrome P450 monooxygenase [Lentithecium fluviatile CBS 122367]|uniref:Putative cytochrome P450 monooxygenase n=1 Tax=Lentithecium fluviatile CBS 122367 TaxID=1168545 RepID=A0A6G1JK20_9PLEO|nr:putative cytochrome P450 monooxygenase [Lentithecium fluviatile CBS 122367]